MYSEGIGTQVSAFYESWAWDLECAGNTKKADKVYQMGLQSGATPIETLKKAHRYRFSIWSQFLHKF